MTDDDAPGGGALDPDLAGSAAAMRAEWRADEEDATAAAHRNWEHTRTVHDRAREWMHGGRVIDVVVDAATFRGTVVAVGEDLLAVQTVSGRVDVALGAPDARAAVMIRVPRVPAGGSIRGASTNPIGAVHFRGRLLEVESAAAPVEIGVAVAPFSLRGALTVGADHVVVDDGGVEHTVPSAQVRWIRPVPSDA